ncbi:MAG: CAP domain-containing protein, partial [Chitinophagales bacterium]
LTSLNACFLQTQNQSPPIRIEGNEREVDRPINRRKADQTIDVRRFDAPLLEDLVHKEINKLRSKKRRTALERDNCLKKAAELQNDYVLKLGKLTHNQRGKERKSVLERSRIFNCRHRMVGENLQYLGFTMITQNGKLIRVEAPTYNEAAKDIAINWKNSSGHYKNLIHTDFFRVGTVAKYDSKKKGIYVTQVFGAVPPEG